MSKILMAQVTLPVRLQAAADGATVQLHEMAAELPAGTPFFGGFADDFLADMGFDAVNLLDDMLMAKPKVIQG